MSEQRLRPYQQRMTPRTFFSDMLRGMLPAPVGVADQFTGNNIRNWIDDRVGATADRNQNEYNAYMRQMVRDDPGYGTSNPFSGLSQLFQRSPQGQPLPAWMMPGAPMPQRPPAPSWNPNYFWNQPQQENNLYGQGQGMMRPPAPQADRGTATLARGQAAVDYARALAQSQQGLNASSDASRMLNRRAAGMMR